ncbi:MAG: restriction endonuclease subunit S [Prolixibacteraceae bacterium]|nr:restriction endonuclease subunit S [Prolixibacteraceae bacterium]
MGVTFKSKLTSVASNINFRIDHRFHNYVQNEVAFKSIPFSRFLIEISNGKDISPNNYDDFDSSDIIYPSVNNFKGGEIKLDDVTFIKDSYPIPKELENDDIIISRSGTVGITYVWNYEEVISYFKRDIKAIPSGYLIVVKVDTKKIVPHFIKLIFNSNHYKKYFNVFGVGKTQKNIAQPDILSIPIPLVEYLKQKELLEKIKPIETKISELKNSKKQPINIINQVFGEVFGFNWDEFEKTKQVNTYSSSISKFANNIDCRMGIRFHNEAGAYIQSFLESKTNKRIKDFISEPIVLGKSVSPSDYDEDGEYFYIAMSNIKSWAFDPEDCKKVSEIYAASNLNKTVKKGDILLARSGEGTIGKVALIEEEDINGIFADFTQRIRLTGFDPLCAYYYMRSEFFQYLVYTHKKGLGNNTNIFPSQIKEFPIPDWDEIKQAEIVEKIKTQLDTQKVIDQQVEVKQQEIDKIIENVIKQEQN